MLVSEASQKLRSIMLECGDIQVVSVEHHGDHWAMINALDIEPIDFGVPGFEMLRAGIVRTNLEPYPQPKNSRLRLVKNNDQGAT